MYLKEQSQKCEFMDLNQEIKQQVELATCSNKLRRYLTFISGRRTEQLALGLQILNTN